MKVKEIKIINVISVETTLVDPNNLKNIWRLFMKAKKIINVLFVANPSPLKKTSGDT